MRLTRRHLAIIGLGMALVTSGAACSRLGRSQPIDDPVAMRAKLLDEIPLGTSIDQARQTMERQGFGCRDVEHGDWLDLVRPGVVGVVRPGIDFLPCSRRDGNLVLTQWMVGVVRTGDRATDILVRKDLIGP